MIESECDRRAFLSQDEFGVSVVCGSVRFSAILDDEFTDDQGIEGSVPTLICTSMDVERADIRKGVSVRVAGIDRKVMRVEPDGTGMTRVRLG